MPNQDGYRMRGLSWLSCRRGAADRRGQRCGAVLGAASETAWREKRSPGDPALRRWQVAALLLGLGFFLSGCGGGGGGGGGKSALRVATAVRALYDLAVEVGGERVEVDLLLPRGVEPHDWEPSPGEVARLRSARVVLLGGGVDPALRRFLKPEQVALSLAGGEPHFWLDPHKYGRAARELGEALSRLDPAGREGYLRRAEELSSRVEDLDRRMKERLSGCRSRVLAETHGAFGPLASRYGLRWLDFSRAATPGRRAELVSRARAEGVRVIFYDGDEGPGEAAQLSAQLGVGILPLYVGEVQEKSYFEAMEANFHSLGEGLDCPK